MTTMKDKLSASVRQAKAAQNSTAKPANKPAAPKPAASKPAAAPKPSASKGQTRVYDGGIPESNATLHPQRVWPD